MRGNEGRSLKRSRGHPGLPKGASSESEEGACRTPNIPGGETVPPPSPRPTVPTPLASSVLSRPFSTNAPFTSSFPPSHPVPQLQFSSAPAPRHPPSWPPPPLPPLKSPPLPPPGLLSLTPSFPSLCPGVPGTPGGLPAPPGPGPAAGGAGTAPPRHPRAGTLPCQSLGAAGPARPTRQ